MLVQTNLGTPVLSKDQVAAMTDVSPALIARMPVEQRLDLAFRFAELKAVRSDAFWSAVQGIALGVLPILAFFGITGLVMGRRKGKKS